MGKQRNGRKRRVPLGRPLPPLADGEQVEITEDDIERAMVSWRKYAPAQYRDLLDAEIVQGDEFE